MPFFFLCIIPVGGLGGEKEIEYMPNNEMQWSSAHPGEIIFLIDQSGSMTLNYTNGYTRSEFACKAINNLINDIIERCYNGTVVRDRCHVAVIGYNNKIECLLSGYLSEIEQKDVEEYDDETPMWIKPIYDDSCTNMKAAFEMAKDIIDKWVETCPDNPAPVIINISDGNPYFDGLDEAICMEQTKEIVNKIKAIDTKDGKVQIFNIMIGNGKKVIKFPISDDVCDNDESKFLFDISTQIPESYRNAANAKYGFTCEEGAKGVVYQANDKDLVAFIQFGSTMV